MPLVAAGERCLGGGTQGEESSLKIDEHCDFENDLGTKGDNDGVNLRIMMRVMLLRMVMRKEERFVNVIKKNIIKKDYLDYLECFR